MGGKEGIERGPVCPLSCWEHLPLTRPCTPLLGGEMAPCWVSIGSLEAGSGSDALDPPAPPVLLSLSPAAPKPGVMWLCTAIRTGAGGTPKLGIPGTYLAVPAPRPPACVPSHRGSAALCLVKPITHRLYSSPSPQHPLLPRSGAWHGPGAQGVSLAECGGHPYGRSKPSLRGSLRFCTPQSILSWGMSGPRSPKRNL